MLTISDDIVERKYLEESVGNVSQFHYHVQYEEVVSVSLSHHAVFIGGRLPKPGHTSIPVLSPVTCNNIVMVTVLT